MVSFCFDDFPRTALSAGGKILKKYGAHGTYYAALGLMNTTNELGDQLTPDDLKSLLLEGHELGGHTYAHSSCRRVPPERFEQDVQAGRNAILQLTGNDAEHFAYPFGHVTLGLKKRVGQQMMSCRGTQEGINGPVIDLNLLRANSLYGQIDRIPFAESLLNHNQNRRGWLIFYTHDVRENPSRFGCTPALLEAVVSRSAEMGFQIKTVGEVVECATRIGWLPSAS
jgi:peptidoglycan/xylan/chitin deacetylase (PgdA/CDA1 family)